MILKLEKTVKLKKIYNKLILSFLKRYFIFNKLKYFLQVNSLYTTDENNNVLFSSVFKYKIVKNEYNDKILKLKYINTSSQEIDNKFNECIYSLESLFDCKILSVNRYYKYIEIELIYKEKIDRLYYQFKQKNKINDLNINLDKFSNWNIKKSPHILVSGNTGSGKSYFLYYLIDVVKSVTDINNIYVFDGKQDELYRISKQKLKLKYVFGNYNNICLCMKKINKDMEYEYKNNIKRKSPKFIFIDEYTSLKLVLSKKDYTDLEKNIKNIILKGRAKGYHLVISLQRASSQNIDLDIRDNAAIKIGLGNLSKENFSMIFGVTKTNINIVNKEMGQGYIMTDNNNIIDFTTPYIDINS